MTTSTPATRSQPMRRRSQAVSTHVNTGGRIGAVMAVQTPEPQAADEVLSCCPTLVDAPLTVEAATELAGVLKALSDPARLRLYSMIASHPDGEVCVCE